MSKKFKTKISEEKSLSNDPFLPDSLSTYGYDIIKELLPNANIVDYLFLMLTGTRPNPSEVILLEKLSILLINPGIRDTGMRAAMNAGVGSAPPSAVLISAISGSSGQYGGSREVRLIMRWLIAATTSDELFNANCINHIVAEENSIWPNLEHTPGFTKFESKTSTFVIDCLNFFEQLDNFDHVNWLANNYQRIGSQLNNGLSINALIAALCCDLGLNEEQAEYLFLTLRLPAAAAFAMEQRTLGWKHFPFFADTVEYTSSTLQNSPPKVDQLIEGYLND